MVLRRALLPVARGFAIVVAMGSLGCGPHSAPAQAEFAGWPGGIEGDRETWVVETIDAWNRDSSPADRTRKYTKMGAGPFGFFRGTNHLYWYDIAADTRRLHYSNAQTLTFIQGDSHAVNFGSFADDDAQVVYDLNDFDESVLDDYQFDVWRLAVSIVLMSRDNGLSPVEIDDALLGMADDYLDALDRFKGNHDEDDFVVTLETSTGRLHSFLEEVTEFESREKMLDDWTIEEGGQRRLDPSHDELREVDDATRLAVLEGFSGYLETLSGGLDPDEAYFAVKSMAWRLNAGNGSLGTPRLYTLIEGPTDGLQDDVILDIKRQPLPTGAHFSDAAAASAARFPTEAERVVTARRALTNDVDNHLGWLVLNDGTYSVSERSPHRAYLRLEVLDTGSRVLKISKQWGELLAAAHARGDKDFDEDLVASSFEAGIADAIQDDELGFGEQVRRVGVEYADQVEADYAAFVASGRVE
ncbi:MAG: DUF2252 domain-containing protein [Nannocystaceae bacterium]|nr:DUF2252 domain-containing protein [Nannocystaceae bacterium]